MGASIKQLSEMIKMFRGQAHAKIARDMRPDYERAARKQGWLLQDNGPAQSFWSKNGKRLTIENGDRILISFDQVTWHDFGQTARKRFLQSSP